MERGENTMSKKVDYYRIEAANVKNSHWKETQGKTRWEKSQGILWKHEGFEVYLEKIDGSYIITEGRTGLKVNDNRKTLPSIAMAKENFKSTVEKLGVENLRNELDCCIEKHGLSPLYQEQPESEMSRYYWDSVAYEKNKRLYA
jgi:hypothetical protein